MKGKIILYYLSVFLICKFANGELDCEIVNKDYKVCKKSGVLVSVSEYDETNQRTSFNKTLVIIAPDVSTITPNAFKNLKITDLEISFGGQKLSFEMEALNGLRWLTNLQISRTTLILKKNIFEAVKSLRSLSISVDQTQQNLAGALKDFYRLRYLTIENSNLNEIKPFMFANTYSPIWNLTLIKSTFKTIQRNAFLTLMKLKSLKIIYNSGFGIIQPGAFNGLHDLEYLDMYWNENLEYLPTGLFIELVSLKWLRLDHNSIKKIDAGAFAGLSIEVLTMSFNKLTTIEHHAFQGFNTSLLYLPKNKIQSIEDGAFENSQIEKIYLFDNVDISGDQKSWGLLSPALVIVGEQNFTFLYRD